MKLGSLFSGYGGLDLGVQAALGPMKTAWVSDIEPGPSTILTSRFPDSPNLGDITQIDWTRVEPVDVIAGGSPCQDLSLSGARAGMKPGTRSGLWESMFTAIKTIRPRLVVWENVRGALSADAFSLMESREGRVGDGPDGPFLRALGRVLGDLASIGYDAQWCGIRASDVGAPHGRYRVFVVAYTDSHLLRKHRGEPLAEEAGERVSNGSADLDRRGGAVKLLPTPRASDGEHGGPNQRGSRGDLTVASAVNLLPTPTARDGKDSEIGPAKHRPDDVDTLSRALVDFGHYAPAVRRWEMILGRAAPDPTEVGSGSRRKCEVHGDSKGVRSGGHSASKTCTCKRVLSPRFCEWMMGLPDGWVTDISISRTAQLRALGNGVVPQQAATAIRYMIEQQKTLEAA